MNRKDMIEKMASAIAKRIGNGMAEKYTTHAEAALEAVFDHIAPSSENSIQLKHPAGDVAEVLWANYYKDQALKAVFAMQGDVVKEFVDMMEAKIIKQRKIVIKELVENEDTTMQTDILCGYNDIVGCKKYQALKASILPISKNGECSEYIEDLCEQLVKGDL